jgi:hypothetical protein
MKIEYEEMIFNAAVKFNILPTQYLALINSVTPSVFNLEFFENDGSARTITNFLSGSRCQVIKILGDGNLTISNNSNIKTNTGANKLLAANKIYRFTYIINTWYEDA